MGKFYSTRKHKSLSNKYKESSKVYKHLRDLCKEKGHIDRVTGYNDGESGTIVNGIIARQYEATIKLFWCARCGRYEWR